MSRWSMYGPTHSGAAERSFVAAPMTPPAARAGLHVLRSTRIYPMPDHAEYVSLNERSKGIPKHARVYPTYPGNASNGACGGPRVADIHCSAVQALACVCDGYVDDGDDNNDVIDGHDKKDNHEHGDDDDEGDDQHRKDEGQNRRVSPRLVYV